jgi:hypothetical protein
LLYKSGNFQEMQTVHQKSICIWLEVRVCEAIRVGEKISSEWLNDVSILTLQLSILRDDCANVADTWCSSLVDGTHAIKS